MDSTKKSPRISQKIIPTYFLSLWSASIAEAFTYPLDLTKTRLQLQGELANVYEKEYLKAHKLGSIGTALEIMREEGFLGLYTGVQAQLIKQSVYTGMRVIFYRQLNEKIFPTIEGKTRPLHQSVLSGMFAGVVAQFISNPADVAKVRMQMEGKRKLLNMTSRVKNTFDAFRLIYKEKAMYRGVSANCMRAALVNVGDVTTYDVSKTFFLKHTPMKDNIVTHITSGLIAGFVGAVLCTPPDICKARIMNQPTDKFGKGLLYKGALDCIYITLKNEGPFGLYKGFVPCWLRIGPWALVFWVTFEQTDRIVSSILYSDSMPK